VAVDGQKYVVRQRLDGDVDLMRKEVYLSGLLRDRAVPAPVVLAAAASEHGVATLSAWLPGIRLDQALERLSSTDLDSAWRSVGAALRRTHAIDLPLAGEIIADRVEPFPGGWAHWVLTDLVEDIRWLQTALSTPAVDLSLLEHVTIGALDVLADAPVRLIHNDALPQNILVAPGADGWFCTGWLDWEFARAADPCWDIGTLDFRPAELVSTAFYEGYGARPSKAQASIYDLLMAVWRTRAELEDGSCWTWPPQQTRIAYLHSLPAHLEQLAQLLDTPP
jgi:aminoglycoside phosphotransferase (APT) family kinase protein